MLDSKSSRNQALGLLTLTPEAFVRCSVKERDLIILGLETGWSIVRKSTKYCVMACEPHKVTSPKSQGITAILPVKADTHLEELVVKGTEKLPCASLTRTLSIA